jgi:hypothetical protein
MRKIDKLGRFVGLPPFKKVCLVCNKEYFITGSSRSRRIKKSRFCSTKCRYSFGQTEETKKKIINSTTGEKNHFYGKHHSKKTKKIISLKASKRIGETASRWKGENAGYVAKHRWISKLLGKTDKCVFCGSENEERYEWANIDHKYSRNPNDYIRLCRNCHELFDRDQNSINLLCPKIYGRTEHRARIL